MVSDNKNGYWIIKFRPKKMSVKEKLIKLIAGRERLQDGLMPFHLSNKEIYQRCYESAPLWNPIAESQFSKIIKTTKRRKRK